MMGCEYITLCTPHFLHATKGNVKASQLLVIRCAESATSNSTVLTSLSVAEELMRSRNGRATLRPLPVSTFGDIAELGHELHV